MARWKRPDWRKICIRYSTIEDCYGSGNFDDAGDDIVAALKSLSDYPEQYSCRFGQDCSHDNPWYHVMVFEVEGISEDHYQQLIQRMTALGLKEAYA
jgi:hypothetical protein